MEIIDVSVPIRPGMIVYEGDPDVHLERVLSIANGETANVSRLDLGVHSGPHVEGLDLRGVEPGEYRLVCLPLRLVGSDGCPRASRPRP